MTPPPETPAPTAALRARNLGPYFGAGAVLWWLGWYLYARQRFQLQNGVTDGAVFTCVGALAVGVFARAVLAARHPDRGASPVTAAEDDALGWGWPERVLAVVVIAQILVLLRSHGLITKVLDFRDTFYSDPTAVFGSTYAFVLYQEFARPVCLWAAIKLLARGGNVRTGALLFAFFCVADSLVSLGRFPLYYLAFFLLVGTARGLMFRKRSARLLVLPGLALMIPIATVIVLVRQASNITGVPTDVIAELFKRGIVDYHVIGFGLFDKVINSRLFVIGSVFPHMSLAWFDYLLAITVSKGAILYTYPWQQVNLLLTSGLEIREWGLVNAFATNLLPLYLDGGLPLIAGVHVALGWIVGECRGRGGQCRPAPLLALFALVFGLFQPIINTGMVWIPALLLAGEWAWATARRAVALGVAPAQSPA